MKIILLFFLAVFSSFAFAEDCECPEDYYYDEGRVFKTGAGTYSASSGIPPPTTYCDTARNHMYVTEYSQHSTYSNYYKYVQTKYICITCTEPDTEFPENEDGFAYLLSWSDSNDRSGECLDINGTVESKTVDCRSLYRCKVKLNEDANNTDPNANPDGSCQDGYAKSQSDMCEPDADGDGVPDIEDAFPEDANEQYDSDGDGLGDNADPDTELCTVGVNDCNINCFCPPNTYELLGYVSLCYSYETGESYNGTYCGSSGEGEEPTDDNTDNNTTDDDSGDNDSTDDNTDNNTTDDDSGDNDSTDDSTDNNNTTNNDNNSSDGSDDDMTKIFDDAKGFISDVSVKDVLIVQNGSASSIVYSYGGRNYTIFDPKDIPADVWTTMALIFKWIAIISGLLVVFRTT